MPYFPDLSRRLRSPQTLNIGWLDTHHDFETFRPPKWLVQKLWIHSKYPLVLAGGYHECDMPRCPGPLLKRNSIPHDRNNKYVRASQAHLLEHLEKKKISRRTKDRLTKLIKSGTKAVAKMVLGIPLDPTEIKLALGADEIRVIGERGQVYAAPNMLYHYVTVHGYKPPDEFIQALKHSPCPPGPEYIASLAAIGWEPRLLKAWKAVWQELDEERAAQKLKIAARAARKQKMRGQHTPRQSSGRVRSISDS